MICFDLCQLVGNEFNFIYFSTVTKMYLFVLLLLMLCACSYDKYRYSFFEGNWVLINYLDTLQKYRSVQKAGPAEMQEIILKRHLDSITFLYNNSESHTFPFYHKTSNQIVIEEYINNRPLSIYINEQAFYLSYKIDSEQYVFVKPDDRLIERSNIDLLPVSTQRVVNSIIFEGIYKQVNNNVPVQFYSNGNITGLNQYSYYETFIGGDSRGFYDGDIVLISGDKGVEYYTWKWHGKTLTLFVLKKITSSREKPYYIKAEKVIELYKIK